MSMLLKFILITLVLTTYLVANPSATCHNDCEAVLLNELNLSNNNEKTLRDASSTKEALKALKTKALLNVTSNSTNQYDNLLENPSTLPTYDNKPNIVEGGIEGTGKFGDVNKLFEFDEEPLTPDEEIQKNSGGEEDGIEGTGRMALGAEHLIAYGPISRFGSIYVNGIKYEIDQAHVEFVHNQAINQLSIGMMVKIQADWTSQSDRTFNAQKVWFDQQLKGPVTDVITTSFGTQLNILGTRVKINDDTVLENLVLKNLKVGHVLAVSGIQEEDNSLLATHIALRSLVLNAKQLIEIESKALSIDVAQQRVFINDIQISTHDAKWINSSLSTLNTGDTIEVVGRYNSNNHQVNAASITVKKPNLNLVNGNKLSVDGVISLFQSNSNFYLSGQRSDASEAEFLSSISSLSNRIRVKANGRINEDNVFIIRTIEIIQPTNASIRAPVNSVNSDSGEISILGVTGKTKSGTLYQSKLTSANKYFNINDISPGDWVELKGKWADDTFTLNAVNLIPTQKRRVLKGQIKKSEDGKISILGIGISTNALLTSSEASKLESGNFILAKGDMLDAYNFDAAEIVLE